MDPYVVEEVQALNQYAISTTTISNTTMKHCDGRELPSHRTNPRLNRLRRLTIAPNLLKELQEKVSPVDVN